MSLTWGVYASRLHLSAPLGLSGFQVRSKGVSLATRSKTGRPLYRLESVGEHKMENKRPTTFPRNSVSTHTFSFQVSPSLSLSLSLDDCINTRKAHSTDAYIFQHQIHTCFLTRTQRHARRHAHTHTHILYFVVKLVAKKTKFFLFLHFIFTYTNCKKL